MKLLVLSLMRFFPCELQLVGELHGIMFKIHCERFWLVLEDIKDIFFLKKINMCLCSGGFCKCNDACFYTCTVILFFNYATYIVCRASSAHVVAKDDCVFCFRLCREM